MCDKEKILYNYRYRLYLKENPHIGNTYEVVLTDAIARFKKIYGL